MSKGLDQIKFIKQPIINVEGGDVFRIMKKSNFEEFSLILINNIGNKTKKTIL